MEQKNLVIEIAYDQDQHGWQQYPTKVTINGEESTLSKAIEKVVAFQPVCNNPKIYKKEE